MKNKFYKKKLNKKNKNLTNKNRNKNIKKKRIIRKYKKIGKRINFFPTPVKFLFLIIFISIYFYCKNYSEKFHLKNL